MRPIASASRRTGRTICLIFFFLLFIGCSAGPSVQGPTPEPIKVSVLFFNDLHGHLKPFEIEAAGGAQTVGGIARLATLVERIRTENRRNQTRTVLLVAGDILQGTPMSTVFRGEPDIKSLNLMGVDAVTVGNHEFDFGFENFINLGKQAAFPFLSANIVQKKTGRRLCRPAMTIPLGHGVALTVIGVTTRHLMTTTKADNVATLEVLDPVVAAKQVHDQIKPDGPVILLSHCRHRTDRAIAAALPDLAAIIGGHDQILLSPYRKAGAVPVFQAFEKGRYLGRVDFSIDGATKKARMIHHEYIPVTADIAEDTRIAGIVADYDRRLGRRFREVIGSAATFMDGERGRIRYEETNLGNFLTDIMRAHTGARIALLNAGAIRSSIRQGPITIEDVFKTVPYANELVVMDLTGAQIRQVLDRSVQGRRETEDGGFLHVSGICFDVQNFRAENIRVGADRKIIEADQTYKVVLTDFLVTGGDGYAMFKDKPMTYTGLPLRELIIDTIRARGTISAEREGRIRRKAPVVH